jgi:hypothetical protein
VPKKSGLFFAHRFDSPERVIQTRLPLSPRSAAPAHTAPAHNASMIAVKGHMLRFATKVPSARQRSEKRRHGTRRKVSIAPGKTRSRVRHSKSDARGAFCHSLWREPVKRLADDASRVTFERSRKESSDTRNRKPKGARLEFLKGCAFREKLKIDFRFFGFSNGNQTPQTAWMPSQTPATVERR